MIGRILDEKSLQIVKREFDKCKKNTPFKHYKITDPISYAGDSIVYKVECLWSRTNYALCIMEDFGKSSTMQGIQTVKSLIEQNQIHVVDYLMDFSVDTLQGKKYCVLIPMLTSLSEYEKTSDNITIDNVEIAVRVGNDLLPLLQFCLDRPEGVLIHYDIKPQNVFFDKNFRNGKGLMLSGFELGAGLNELAPIGTVLTVSPEIANMDFDLVRNFYLCDMYSLGIVMYYYLNGREYPFENDYDKRMATKGALPEPRYGSKQLKTLVVKATQYYPKDRFASPNDMLRELQQCEEYREFINPKA